MKRKIDWRVIEILAKKYMDSVNYSNEYLNKCIKSGSGSMRDLELYVNDCDVNRKALVSELLEELGYEYVCEDKFMKWRKRA